MYAGVYRRRSAWQNHMAAAAFGGGGQACLLHFQAIAREKAQARQCTPPPHPGPPPSPNPPVRSPNPPAPSPNHQQTHMKDGFPISMTYCEKSILFNFNIYHVTQQMKFYILGDSMCRGLGIFNYNFRSHSLSFINDFMFNIEPFTITTVYGGHKISLITKKLRRNLNITSVKHLQD